MAFKATDCVSWSAKRSGNGITISGRDAHGIALWTLTDISHVEMRDGLIIAAHKSGHTYELAKLADGAA